MTRVDVLRGEFGQRYFGEAHLGDQRRTRRLVQVAQRLLENPGGTLPERIGDPSELTGLYRLMDMPQVTHQSVLASAVARTRQKMAELPVVLVLHDTTELDYTSKKSLQDLGQIGNGGGRGYICHNALALTPQREILGLAHQILHKRRKVPAGETPTQKRLHPQRESRLWLAACQALGPAPAGHLWVDIADRGADTFEFIAFELQARRMFIVRSAKDRNLWGDDHLGADRLSPKLHGYVRDLPALGFRTLDVPAVTGTHPARQAQMALAAGPVTLAGSHFGRGEAPEAYLEVWAIHIWEVQAPAGIAPVEWILLTNLPSGSFAAACRHVDWYSLRPTIEDYHKGQKTGCRIEALQFTDEARLEPAIGLLSVVAATLLSLRELAQHPQAEVTPATRVVPPLYVRVLAAWRWGQARPLNVREFALALARLGGHQNRKHDGFPGWLTLWRGWEKLVLMVRGVQALEGHSV